MSADKIKKYLKDTGMYVFVNILYPALITHEDIDVEKLCQLYPEYSVRVKSDKSKRTRLSKAKSIIVNNWQKEALGLICFSKIDEKSKNLAKEFYNTL